MSECFKSKPTNPFDVIKPAEQKNLNQSLIDRSYMQSYLFNNDSQQSFISTHKVINIEELTDEEEIEIVT